MWREIFIQTEMCFVERRVGLVPSLIENATPGGGGAYLSDPSFDAN